MATTRTINYDVNANTQDSEKQIDNLEKSVRTLDGAINLVGGSVEVLAGGLAATGAVSEENAERFQSLAIGAIAFADGSKRALDGVKTLAENTQFLTKVTKAFGIAQKIALGPIGLAVAAIAAIGAAVVLLKDRLEVANKVFNFFKNIVTSVGEALGFAKTEAEKFQEAQAELVDDREFELELLRAQGAATEDLIKKERELLQTKINATKEGTQERIEAERELALFEAQLETDRREAAAKAEEERKAKEQERLENTRVEQQELVTLRKKGVSEIVGAEIKGAEKTLDIQRTTNAAIAAEQERAKQRAIAIAAAEEEAKQKLLTSGIDNIQAALGQLFGENKAVASANVLIDAAQAGVGIIKNSQTTGPFAIAYQATQFALLAATTIASLRQINQAEPTGGAAGGSSTPRPGAGTFGGGGASVPVGGFGQLSGQAAGFGFGAPQTTSEPPAIQAYVLAGDVSDGLEANNRLNRRRTL